MRTYPIRITEQQRRLVSTYLRHILLTAVDGDLPDGDALTAITEQFEGLPYRKDRDVVIDLTARIRDQR